MKLLPVAGVSSPESACCPIGCNPSDKGGKHEENLGHEFSWLQLSELQTSEPPDFRAKGFVPPPVPRRRNFNYRLRAIYLFLLLLMIAACGGGGGGGGTTATLVGRVLDVKTGGPIAPRATVQVGTQTVQTEVDGSFQLAVTAGTTGVTVDANTYGAFTFTFPAAADVTDVGDLWVGPQKVRLTGRVLNSSNSNAIAGATVSFAGRKGVTNSVGTYVLNDVAYSSANLAAFWGIVGTSKAIGFFKVDFTAQGKSAVSGTVTLDDLRMTPQGDSNPPPFPFTLWGRISPSASAPGTIVTLKLSGTPVRIFNVGSDGAYYFWVLPGSYTIEAVNGALTGSNSAILTQTNQVIQKDVSLN